MPRWKSTGAETIRQESEPSLADREGLSEEVTVALGPEWWVGVTEVNSEGGAREGQRTCQEREQLVHSPGVGCNLVP